MLGSTAVTFVTVDSQFPHTSRCLEHQLKAGDGLDQGSPEFSNCGVGGGGDLGPTDPSQELQDLIN